ncbi:unnamed protein product, partial [Symbiodinium natans]
ISISTEGSEDSLSPPTEAKTKPTNKAGAKLADGADAGASSCDEKYEPTKVEK